MTWLLIWVTHCFPALCLMPFSAFRGFCVHQSVLKGEWRSRGSSSVLVVCCHCGQVPPPPCLHFSLQPRTTQRLPITSWSPPPPNPPRSPPRQFPLDQTEWAELARANRKFQDPREVAMDSHKDGYHLQPRREAWPEPARGIGRAERIAVCFPLPPLLTREFN